MAKGLADAGATVVVAARDEVKSEAAVKELAATGAKAASIAVDVTDAASCRALVEATVARFGRLDILINNAGINIRKAPESYSAEEWHRVLDINLTGSFLCSQAAYPALCQAGGGKIVNIGSMMSIFGASFAVPYAASKGGVVQLTKALATAWAKHNIQVNAVLPGWIDTDLTRDARRQVEGLHERIEARTPARRWGEPRDMAGVAVFLSAPASDFITGATITVDGGYSVQG
jgi:2-deoxy-D-gluconate 3-dehydrogenase